MKEIKVVKKGEEGYLYVGGIPYVPIIDKKEIDLMVSRIVPLLIGHIDKERILRGALMNTDVETLAIIFKKLFDKTRKRKAAIKQKDGCLYLSIGGTRLDIQD